MADNDVVAKNAGNAAEDGKYRSLAERVVPPWTNLTRGVLEKSLE